METTLYRGSQASGRHRVRSASSSRSELGGVSSDSRRRNSSLDQSSGFLETSENMSLGNQHLTSIGLDSDSSQPFWNERMPVQPLSSDLENRVRRLQTLNSERPRSDDGNSPELPRGASAATAENTAERPRPRVQQTNSRGVPTSMSSSASWNGARDHSILGGLAMGPHFMPVTSSLFSDNDDETRVGRLGVADSAGSTWPPVEGRALFWDSVRRVGVLSVLELERQIGLASFRRSLGSFGSLGAIDDETKEMEDRADDVLFAGAGGGASRISRGLTNVDNASIERSSSTEEVDQSDLRQASGFQRSPSLVSLHQAFIYDDDDGEASDSEAPTMDAPPAQNGEQMPGQSVNTRVIAPPAVPVGAPLLSAEDALLFDGLFDMHPFAAAAFLRAFIACSFGLMMFHVHSLLTWPDESATSFWALGSVCRKWLIVQVGVLAVQVPLRMEVQRALFRVSTARDTADAKRRLRLVFASSAWRTNRKFGRATLALMLLGPLLRQWSCGFTGLGSRLELQLVSINSSNLLVSVTRAALVISLHYFIHVAAPPQSGEAQRHGLSEGTIRRLRRITFCASTIKHENDLTQCSVCLEHYEENDRLMVLPCDTRHNFHVQCIEPWLLRMNTCPLCQRGVPEEKEEEKGRETSTAAI